MNSNEYQKLSVTTVTTTMAWLLIGLCAIGCKSRNPDAKLLDLAEYRQDCGEEVAGSLPFPSYFSLKKKVEPNKGEYTTKSSILQLLPASYKNHYLLFHDTKSLDSADFATPRMVFFGDPDNPRLIMATSGHENEKKFEIIEFVDQSDRFCFREIRVGSRGASFRDTPGSCFGCHNEDPRPNWEPHDVFPRVFGSRAGLMAARSQEAVALSDWQQASRRAGTYGQLGGPDDTSRTGEKGVEFVGGADHAPHVAFTRALTQMNNQRIGRLAAEFVEGKDQSVKTAMLASFLGCPNVYSLLGGDEAGALADFQATEKLVATSLTKIKRDVDRANGLRGVSAARLDVTVPLYRNAINNLVYIARKFNEFDMVNEWSMSFEGAPLFASDRYGISDAGYFYYKRVFGGTDPALSDPALYNANLRDSKYSQDEILEICTGFQ